MKLNCKAIRDSELEISKFTIKNENIKANAIVIQVGNREDSNKYVSNKINTLNEQGIGAIQKRFDEGTHIHKIMNYVSKCNIDDAVTGIIIQSPLVGRLRKFEDMLIGMINPKKDIDCITPQMESMVYGGEGNMLPCTVSGIMKIFKYNNIDLKGKDVLVIGRSKIVGKPMAMALINAGATVTVANSHTKDLQKHITNNEIIISAVGKIDLITPCMVSNEHILIDVGINFTEDGKMVGDVNRACYDIVKAYTTVPGGVGQLTTAEVVGNIIKLYKIQKEKI